MAMAMEQVVGESRLERVVPWASSFLMHAGFALVAAFVCFAAMGQPEASSEITIPSMFTGKEDPTREQPFNGKDDSLKEQEKAMQDRFKEDAQGIDPLGALNVAQLTSGGLLLRDGVTPDIIGVGLGGGGQGNAFRNGIGGVGLRAPYGPGMIDGGPFKIIPGVRAKKVVYLLDHSGSMLDSFDYLRQEVIERTTKLMAFQQFSVIMFSEDVTVLGPDTLQRASADVKADVATRLRKINAQGMNNDLLEPFQKGFEKAFAMKPDVIIFLTDGNFDPHLVEVVKKLNKDKVQIQTIAFVEITPDAEKDLKQIAKDAGGQYKFVAKKDLN